MSTPTPHIPVQRRPLELVQVDNASPFDRIRHRHPERGEWWSARDLMELMGYTNWRNFSGVVERAMSSLAIVQGPEAVTGHFDAAVNREKPGVTGNAGENYILSRFACYLVAMAGDEHKPRVAEARIYFAVKTREAEVAQAAPAVPQTFADALQLAADQQREIERQQAALADQRKIIDWQAPRAQFTETFVRPDAGTTIRDFAKQIGMRERDVWGYLEGAQIVYRDANRERRPYAQYAKHFYLVDQASVEHRNPDGTSHKTMKLTGPGKVWLAARLNRAKIPAPPSWEG